MAFYNCEKQAHPIDDIIDRKLIKVVKKILRNKVNETLKINIKNTDRTVGAMLSGYIAKKKGHSGLNIDSLNVPIDSKSSNVDGLINLFGPFIII